ncbi:MAG: hypothetical protein D3905_14945 [Candidatus Electrothrix sp. AS4_5]|nr:hypothetical protein [Candidatus Electrothrix gigas]
MRYAPCPDKNWNDPTNLFITLHLFLFKLVIISCFFKISSCYGGTKYKKKYFRIKFCNGQDTRQQLPGQ